MRYAFEASETDPRGRGDDFAENASFFNKKERFDFDYEGEFFVCFVFNEL